VALHLADQARWQVDRQWRFFTETLAYWWEQFLTVPPTDESTDLNWLEPVARLLALVLVGLVLGVGLLRLGRWLWLQWFRKASRPILAESNSMLTNRPVQEWLRQAQIAQTQGDYAGACRAYYMALIVRLRAINWLNPAETLTNGEYWRQLEAGWALGQHPPSLRHPLLQLFQTHTRLYYGGQAISLETLEQCRDAYFQAEPELIKQQR